MDSGFDRLRYGSGIGGLEGSGDGGGGFTMTNVDGTVVVDVVDVDVVELDELLVDVDAPALDAPALGGDVVVAVSTFEVASTGNGGFSETLERTSGSSLHPAATAITMTTGAANTVRRRRVERAALIGRPPRHRPPGTRPPRPA